MLSSSQLIPGGLMDEYLAEGGSQASGYVKKLIAQRQADVNRVKNPSSWLLNVYPTLVRPSGINKDKAAARIQALFRGRRGRMEANVIKDIRGHEKNQASREKRRTQRKKKDELALMHSEDLERRTQRKKKMNQY